MMTMQPLILEGNHPPEPVFIHLPCRDTMAWGQVMVDEYGPIQRQGCDRCEGGPDGKWRQVYVETEDRK